MIETAIVLGSMLAVFGFALAFRCADRRLRLLNARVIRANAQVARLERRIIVLEARENQ